MSLPGVSIHTNSHAWNGYFPNLSQDKYFISKLIKRVSTKKPISCDLASRKANSRLKIIGFFFSFGHFDNYINSFEFELLTRSIAHALHCVFPIKSTYVHTIFIHLSNFRNSLIYIFFGHLLLYGGSLFLFSPALSISLSLSLSLYMEDYPGFCQ